MKLLSLVLIIFFVWGCQHGPHHHKHHHGDHKYKGYKCKRSGEKKQCDHHSKSESGVKTDSKEKQDQGAASTKKEGTEEKK